MAHREILPTPLPKSKPVVHIEHHPLELRPVEQYLADHHQEEHIGVEHHPSPTPAAHYKLVHPTEHHPEEHIHVEHHPSPTPTTHYKLVHPVDHHPEEHIHVNHHPSPTPATHYKVVHHHSQSPSPHPSIPMHFEMVPHDPMIFHEQSHPSPSSVPVTVSPSLFVPHHTAERRFSVVESEEPSPRRTRPTSFKDMGMVTVSSTPATRTNYNTPLHITPAPVTIKSPTPTFKYSTPSPQVRDQSTPSSFFKYSTPSPKIIQQSTPRAEYKYSTPTSSVYLTSSPSFIYKSTPAPSIYKSSTISPSVYKHSTISPKSSFTNVRPTLPPLDVHPQPLLVHKGDPLPPQYNIPTRSNEVIQYEESMTSYANIDESHNEEPEYLIQLVPNPKYKKTQHQIPSRPKPTQRRMDRMLSSSSEDRDPSLYPYLYVLSSYLPESQHSLVVAKKS